MANHVDNIPANEAAQLGGALDLPRSPLSGAEREHLEHSCHKLSEECDRLRREVARLEAERDQYLASLYAAIPSSFHFEEQELIDLERNGFTLEQVMDGIFVHGTK